MKLRASLARLGAGARLDRIEQIYLVALRVAVLAAATVCLAAGLWFALDASWRVFVPTDVETLETTVAPEEVVALVRTSPSTGAEEQAPEIAPVIRERHAGFVRDVFARYYAVYRTAAQSFGKQEDEVLTAEQLLVELGYDLETYVSGERMTTKLFIEDPDYQEQAQAAVAAAMTAEATRALLTQYRDAEQVQECTTRTVTRRVNRVCGYYYPYDCSYTERRPVRECVMVYPDGIVSPLEAFRRSDAAFGELWLSRRDENRLAAAAVRAERHATRAEIGPKFMLALRGLGIFLGVMSFFLVVAIERHLRRIAMEAEVEEGPPGATETVD